MNLIYRIKIKAIKWNALYDIIAYQKKQINETFLPKHYQTLQFIFSIVLNNAYEVGWKYATGDENVCICICFV